MIPWSSPRSSGCRATDWIIEAKTVPMPMPAPSDPSPMPSARPSALPASTTFPSVCASSETTTCSSLVLGLDGRADVDGGEGGEDEGLDGDDDDDLEEVEGRGGRDRQHGREAGDDEDQADHEQDQHVASQHVGVEADGEAD